MRCSRAWCGTPFNFGGCLYGWNPDFHMLHGCTMMQQLMCFACLVCSILPVLHFLQLGLFVLYLVRTGSEH